jgi:hypothetical protein
MYPALNKNTLTNLEEKKNKRYDVNFNK